METVTTRHRAGDRTLAARHRAPLAPQAEELLGMLAKAQLHERVWYRLGWSSVSVRDEGAELVLCEPDFRRAARRDVVADVSITLLANLAQKTANGTMKRVPCKFTDTVWIARPFLFDRHVVLHRHWQPVCEYSGWYAGPAAPRRVMEAKQWPAYDWMDTAELFKLRPVLVEALHLPPGALATFDCDKLMHADPAQDPPAPEDIDPEALLSAANESAAGGRHDEALEYYDAALMMAPTRPAYWYAKACQLLYGASRIGDARAAFERAIEHDGGDKFDATGGLGVCLVLEGDAARGLQMLDRSLALEVRAGTWEMKAYCLQRLGRQEEANECRRRAQTLEPKASATARALLARIR